MTAPILLATDGSEYARTAAERALSLARERGASLYVVCVVDRRVVEEPGLSSAELATIQAENHGHACITEVRRLAEGSGVDVDGEYRHGVPHEVVLDVAAEIDAGTIVVGEHGDHVEHLGGVGRKIVAGSDREVVVVELDG